jgi:hypothetical protein
MNIKNAKLPPRNLPPVNENNEYAYRYRITSEDRNRISEWSPIKIIAAPEVSFLEESDGDVVISGNSITATWSDENNRPNYDVFTRFYFFVNKASLTGNVAKVHTTINHNLVKGDVILIDGISSVFNGAHTVTDVTADTVSFAKTNTNISQYNVSPNGKVGLNYPYHGTTPIHTYSFVKRSGAGVNVAIQVEGISVDGTKPFYGAIPKTTMYPEGNPLLVYTKDKSI